MAMVNRSEASSHPFVTVVIPCRNETLHLRPLLDSILSSTYPRERLEFIFVDGMSVDGTRKALEQASGDHPFIRVLDNPRIITPAALNLGIKAARGDIIVRMDAHAEFPRDYISRCVQLLQSHPRIGSAGGRSVHLPNGGGPWARAVAFATAHRFGVGNVAYLTSLRPGLVDTVAYGTFRRAVLEEVGLFDERLTRNQDNELHARLQQADYGIAFDPDIVSYYRNQPSLTGLVRQGFFTGMWNVYTLYLHPYTWKLRRFIPMAFIAYLAFLAAAAFVGGRWAAAAAVPLGLYAALVAGFSLTSGGTPAGRLRVAATFVCYHLSYGVGPFVGLFNVATGRWHSHLGRPLGARAAGAGEAPQAESSSPQGAVPGSTMQIEPATPEDLDGVVELLNARPPAFWMRNVSDADLRTFLRYAVASDRAVLLLARTADSGSAGYVFAVLDPRRFWLGFALRNQGLARKIMFYRLRRILERRRDLTRREHEDAGGLPLFSWAPSRPDNARIIGLYVRKEQRRKGIAMELYLKLFAALKEKGGRRVEEYMGADYPQFAGKFPEVCGWLLQKCRCGGYKLSKTL